MIRQIINEQHIFTIHQIILATKHFHWSTIFPVHKRQQLSKSYTTVLAGFAELLFSLDGGGLRAHCHLGTNFFGHFDTI